MNSENRKNKNAYSKSISIKKLKRKYIRRVIKYKPVIWIVPSKMNNLHKIKRYPRSFRIKEALKKMTTNIMLSAVSYSIPRITCGVGFYYGFDLSTRHLVYSSVIANCTSDSVFVLGLVLLTDILMVLCQTLYYGIPGGLDGGLYGIIVGSFWKKQFDSNYRKK